LHREKTKQIGTRVTPEKHHAVETAGEKAGLNLQQTVEAAIDAFLSNAGVVLPAAPKPPRRGSATEQYKLITEKLQLLEVGQRDIQDGVGKVLREMARLTAPNHRIETQSETTEDHGDRGQVAGNQELDSATRIIGKRPGGSKYIAPTKKDRPRKPGKAPESDPDRREGGTR
jgi:hypothetical protein